MLLGSPSIQKLFLLTVLAHVPLHLMAEQMLLLFVSFVAVMLHLVAT